MKKKNKGKREKKIVECIESKMLLVEAIFGFEIAISAFTALVLSAMAYKFDNDACGYASVALICEIVLNLVALLIIDDAWWENEEEKGE